MIYLQLFGEFFKIGLFAIGGGMATIPFLYDLSDKYPHWFTHTDLANMIAVGESTPGPIGVNMATYVGYLTGGSEGGTLASILGAITATLGLITPSLIIILIVATILSSFKNNRFVNHAFYGLRPASAGLIAAAGISVICSNLLYMSSMTVLPQAVNWKGLVLAVLLFVFTNYVKKTKKWHPIVFIGISAVLGIVFQMG